MRFAHVFHQTGPMRSKLPVIRQVCQPLVIDEFIETCEWMLAGKEDIVYIHPEHGELLRLFMITDMTESLPVTDRAQKIPRSLGHCFWAVRRRPRDAERISRL